MTDLSNLDNFLLEADLKIINAFIREELLKNNPEIQISEDVRYFFSRLARKIKYTEKLICHRNCIIRRNRIDEL